MTPALASLERVVGREFLVAADAIDPKYLRDWMVPMEHGAPMALVRPGSTAEVAAVLRICHDARLPVVPQGGLTGLAGGATPIDGCVILSLERLTGIEEIDDAAATMTVWAGTPLQVVQDAASEAGLFFPLDLGARGSCQIGGNVATNAGGNRVIRYGMTRDLVLGLEVVLADGTVVTSLNKLIKNNAGPDIRQMFVGSEGTLGIITRVVLRLQPQPRSQCVAFCAVDDYGQVVSLLKHVRASLGASLSAFEVMWPDFYALVTQTGSGIPQPLAPSAGIYVLVEALGTNQDVDRAHFEQTLVDALESGIVADSVLAQSAADVRDFWRVRDASGDFPRLLWPHVGFDIGIPVRDIGEFVTACRDRMTSAWPGAVMACYGHIGDSNLHICVKVVEGEQPEPEIDDLVYGLVREWRGTVSAEHGIGLMKRKYLPYTRSPEELAVVRLMKQALDPRGILNPGKVIGPAW